MAYFLAKTDPETYSLDDLKRDGKTEWDGVRNPAAVNAIKEMKPGDTVIIYHTGNEKAVLGLAKVVSEPRPDPNDDRSWVADFEYVKHTKKPVTLRGRCPTAQRRPTADRPPASASGPQPRPPPR